jgi:ketosteroid isomerase-like protein
VITHHTRRPSQGPGIDRRELLRKGMAGTALGAAALALPGLARADASAGSAESVQVGEIYQLQAAFHRAKTTQDLDLMMSLWAVDAVLVNQGDSNSPYAGTDAIRAFFAGSGSFTHRRLSLVPSFKTQIGVQGDQAWLYFECHDVGDYDLASRFIAADLFLAGTLRHVGGTWLFWHMTAGKSFPLSADHYYFP